MTTDLTKIYKNLEDALEELNTVIENQKTSEYITFFSAQRDFINLVIGKLRGLSNLNPEFKITKKK